MTYKHEYQTFVVGHLSVPHLAQISFIVAFIAFFKKLCNYSSSNIEVFYMMWSQAINWDTEVSRLLLDAHL
jgi:hypothetical protein